MSVHSIYEEVNRWVLELPPVKQGIIVAIVFLFSWTATNIVFGGGTDSVIVGLLLSIVFGVVVAVLQKWGPVW